MTTEELTLSIPINSPVWRTYSVPDFIEATDGLDKGLYNIIASKQSGESIFKIGKLQDLDISKINSIGSVVRDIVLGCIFLGDMTPEIERRLGVDEQTAGDIGDQILGEIFAPVWKELEEWNVKQYALHKNEQKIARGSSQIQKTSTASHSIPQDPKASTAIATGASFRTLQDRGTINQHYNPRAQRLQPFLTSAAQARLATITSKPSQTIRPQQNRKVLDLRKKS